jgi:DNA-binding IclR family transcriptional regulator
MSIFAFRKLVQRIREELEALPEFRMNAREAATFFGLDPATSWRVLSELRLVGVVSRDAECRYYLAEPLVS